MDLTTIYDEEVETIFFKSYQMTNFECCVIMQDVDEEEQQRRQAFHMHALHAKRRMHGVGKTGDASERNIIRLSITNAHFNYRNVSQCHKALFRNYKKRKSWKDWKTKNC